MKTQELVEMIYQKLQQHDLFYGHGTDNAWDEACWLLSALRGPRQIGRQLDPERIASTEEVRQVNAIIRQRIEKRKPLAYLVNEAWFAGFPFYVDERVLVPRSPIAELIANDFAGALPEPPRHILDLCCGGGCIGLACALVFPDARVTLADIEPGALEIAARNIAEYDLADRVTVCQSDLFDNVQDSFDLIICNPPYVSGEEYRQLPPEYHQEPLIGLVCDEHGLSLPLQVLDKAGAFLAAQGVLILETGNNWQALEKARPDLPFLWLEFEKGGHGVCVLQARALVAKGQKRV